MKQEILVQTFMDKEDIDSLRTLVIDEFEGMDINVKPGGGYRGNLRKIDWGLYNFEIRKKQIGFFEYTLTNGSYTIQFDLKEMPAPFYKEFLRIARLKFPKIFNN